MEFFLYLSMKKKIITISLITLFSVGLWVSVALTEEYITTVQAPVLFTDLPKNYSLGYSSANQVYLQLKGKGWDLAKIILGKRVNFDISVHRRAGKHKSELSGFIQSNPWLTSNFHVLEIAPAQIEYEIERTASKKVKLIKNFQIEFKQGYGATSKVKFEPETIKIFGAPNLISQIDSLKTIYKKFSDVSENVKLELPIEQIDGVKFSQDKCEVEFEVQKIVDKAFEGIVVETRNVPYSRELVLFPGKVDIVLRGGINKLGKLTNDSIKAYIDYWRALKEESGSIEPVIEIPSFTTLVNSIPNKFEFVIKQY